MSRWLGKINNRGGHFYLAMYWAEAIAEQDEDQEFKAHFAEVAEQMRANEEAINEELIAVQGNPVAMKGYFKPDESIVRDKMRPSKTFNEIIDNI